LIDCHSSLFFCIRKEGKNVKEAIETLRFYFSSFQDKDITEQTKSKKGGGRKLYVIADDNDSTRHSRVHAIVLNKGEKAVDVVFRGTTNVSPKNAWWDWSTNVKATWKVNEKT